MGQPLVTDYRAIIDALRRRGSVHYPQTAMPVDFIAWRRRVRQVARLADLRISVIRGSDYVLIENRDYQVSEDDNFALTDVIEAHPRTRPDLTFDDAVHARGRQRLRLAPPPEARNDVGER